MHRAGVLLLGLELLAGACSRLETKSRLEPISVPLGAMMYTTAVQPQGAIGGNGVFGIQADVVATLTARGDQAEADGALSAVASWALNEVAEGRAADAAAAKWALRRFGFGGEFVYVGTFGTTKRLPWQQQLSTITQPVNRYGIRVSPNGQLATVVFGRVELDYEPIARMLRAGEVITLKGKVHARFDSCHLYLAKPDGTVDEKTVPARDFNASYVLSTPGEYRLEVMGDGKRGPVVLANLPLFVGVPEPGIRRITGTPLSPEETKPRLLALLNEARKIAGKGPLEPDAELDELALSHSIDMVQENFFGHVSPTMGTLEDRVRRAEIHASLLGENVCQGYSPEEANADLLASPGHRSAMLRPDFTHVGIGVTPQGDRVAITMDFARRPTPAALPTSAGQIEDAILKQRADRGLPLARVDAIYSVAARVGAEALSKGADANQLTKVVEQALQREVDRRQTSRPSTCILHTTLLEVPDLSWIPTLSSPGVRHFGVGSRRQTDLKGDRMATVFILDGVVPCQ